MIATRRQAASLLESLIDERSRLEARLREAARSDAVAGIAGRGALDRAIATTRSIVRSIDRLLGVGLRDPSRRHGGSAGLESR
ncbi:MAG TPA: hypothetical protein PKC43_14245 [Phycisphaerales bacterium]|nr:hypothetical protein [Phycisphaerales bacterium]HMP38594.1 hypothetical protein [Phycisphaerales bacterium]